MFTIEVFQNAFLPAGNGRVDAIVTVCAAANASAAAGDAVEGLVLDVSGSMKGHSIDRLKHAARRAIHFLDSSIYFFVVVFEDSGRVVFELAPATPENKAAAERSIQGLEADGSTRMSAGLAMARQQFQKKPGARGHVLFLTDGKNNDDDRTMLSDELAQCENLFQADCRGVGTDWEPAQLSRIANKLLGTAQIIPEASGMERDFKEAMQRALSRSVANVRLRLATPKTGKVKLVFIKQMNPAILDLTGRETRIDANTMDFPTGAWSAGESRDFHLAFELPAGALGDEMLVCRPGIVHGQNDTTVKGNPILATWIESTDERSAIINPQVAHYTNQDKLAEDIREGLAARARGDFDAATALLGRAAQTAEQSGNMQATSRLREVVTMNEDGTVNLRANVHKAKLMDLDLGSIVTARAPKNQQGK